MDNPQGKCVCHKTMHPECSTFPLFVEGNEYEWRWMTDKEEHDFPEGYCCFHSEISEKHIVEYDDVREYFMEDRKGDNK